MSALDKYRPGGASTRSGVDKYAPDPLEDGRDIGMLEAGARGLFSGLTFNFDDELVGLFGGDSEAWRNENERARRLQPGAYTVGNIGGAFVPIGLPFRAAGLGMRAANVAPRFSTPLRNAIGDVGKFVGTSAAAGTAYGQAARLGDAQGSLEERASEAFTPENLMTDAAYGTGFGVLGHGLQSVLPPSMLLGGGLARAVETRNIQKRKQTGYDVALGDADRALRSGETFASAAINNAAYDRARNDFALRMSDEMSGGLGGEAAALQDLAKREFGIDLSRSQAAGDKTGKAWLAEALDGVHGGRAQDLARKIVERQTDQAPGAFDRIVMRGGDGAPSDAASGAAAFQGALHARNAAERAREDELWGGLTDFYDVRMRTREPETLEAWRADDPFATSDRGVPALVTSAEDGMRRAGLADTRGALLFDHGSEIVKAEARASMPRAAGLYDRMKEMAIAEGAGTRLNPGEFRDLIDLRRAAKRAYDSAATPSDRRAVQIMRRAIDDWTNNEMELIKRGDGGLARFREASAATRSNREFFVDNDDIAKIVAPETDAGRALAQLIGANGVKPTRGAHLTMDAIRERFGRNSAEWRNLEITILRRFTDRIAEAPNRDNPHVFRTVYAQLDDLIKNAPEFVKATFSPMERRKLAQLRDVLRTMQTPGPGASNPSRSGVTLASLQQNTNPGLGWLTGFFQDAIAAPTKAAAEMRATPRPRVASEALKSGALGAFFGPRSIPNLAGLGAANVAFGQQAAKEDAALQAEADAQTKEILDRWNGARPDAAPRRQETSREILERWRRQANRQETP